MDIWIEKYRPKTFSEIKGQEDIINKIEALVNSKNIPHLLFAGPAGVGKTTLALVIARTLFGDNWSGNFLELNASDERGIDVIRNKVKDFARTKPIGDFPFKIIYLDECDALTKEAQQALRRTMENFAHTCRFILSCNYSSKIIDPIQSRCAIFRFKPLSDEAIREIISSIAKNEGLTLTEEGIKALIEVSGGDVRRLENIMQACAALSNTIDENIVFNTSSVARPKDLEKTLLTAFKGNFLEARDSLLKVMYNYGLSGLDVIKQLQSIIWDLPLNDKDKLDLIINCGEVEFRMVEGANEFIQLESLLANIAKKGTKK